MNTLDVKQAVLYMGLYALTHSVVLSAVSYLSHELSTSTLFFFRILIGLMFIFPVLVKRRTALFQTHYFSLHILRAFAAFLGGYALFYALSTIPLTLVVAISFTAPVIATLTSCLLLKETMTKAKAMATMLGFIGVFIILRPNLDSNLYGILAALITASMAAVAFITVKKLTSHENNDTVVALPFFLILPISTCFAVIDWTMPDQSNLPLLLLIGAGFSVSQYALAKAFSLAEASLLLPIDFCRLIFVSVISVLFFGNDIDGWTVTGGTIILMGSLLIFTKESNQKKVERASHK